MSVRPARPADRPAVRRLQTHLPRPSPRLLAAGLDVGGVLVSDADSGSGGPVGYLLSVGVTFGRPSDGPGGSAAAVPPATADATDTHASPAGRGAHLAELVVAPAARREGRATALLDRLFAVADGPVTVAVHPGNEAALALYRSCGFERVDRRENYFGADPACWLVRR
ncbi:MAG: GNAT family N-acetyltransferase [Haloferacaceae archaeon]